MLIPLVVSISPVIAPLAPLLKTPSPLSLNSSRPPAILMIALGLINLKIAKIRSIYSFERGFIFSSGVFLIGFKILIGIDMIFN